VRVTMVKKRLADGNPCAKCAQAEDLLRRRGLWERVDEVVWAVEGEPDSPGMRLGAHHRVDRAPFFVVTDDHGDETVYESALLLIRERLSAPASFDSAASASFDSAGSAGSAQDERVDERVDERLSEMAAAIAGMEPPAMVAWAVERWGSGCALAFSGAEDVAVIDMAAATGRDFSVFTLDTGRLHPETLAFIDQVRERYQLTIDVFSPDPARLEPLVRAKGLFSFYRDGHHECCAIRKVEPLGRALTGRRAWLTGQRRDQNPETRGELAAIELDGAHVAADGRPLVKLNPLAGWTGEQVWSYIRERGLPENPLHARGFASIGCAPCTRPIEPGQHERDGRWWWEQSDAKECGLHVVR